MTINQSTLLHQECITMLKRPSKILLVNEVTHKLFGSLKENNNKFEWYKILLFCLCCYKN